MTEAVITDQNGYIRVDIMGHAGYGAGNGLPKGCDIVCAAVSVLGQALVQYFLNLAEEKKAAIQAEVQPGKIKIRAVVKAAYRKEAQGALDAVRAGFDLLADQYPEYVRKGWGHRNGTCGIMEAGRKEQENETMETKLKPV